jgi:hypothetical protein
VCCHSLVYDTVEHLNHRSYYSRVDNARAILGPFELPSGKNCEWSSHVLKQYVYFSDMPAMVNREYSSSRHHDIIVVVSRVPLPPATYGPAMVYGATGRVASENKMRYSWTFSEPATVSAKSGRSPSKSSSAAAVPKARISLEMTNARIPTLSNEKLTAFRGQAGASQSSSSKKLEPVDPITLQVVDQMVVGNGTVYNIQGIYGLAHSVQKEPVREANEEGEEGQGDNHAEEAGAPGLELNTDSNECVICLTDPRSVVVYPCRHACMCYDCAQALPAQNNKCPICRRPAKMMILLPQQEEDAAV